MSSARVRLAAVLAVAGLLFGLRAAASPDVLSGARIALRCEDARVLIVGDIADDRLVAEFTGKGLDSSPGVSINAPFSPAEVTWEITAGIFHKLSKKNVPGFAIGSRWQIYPGAGPPVAISIEKLVLLYNGDGNQYVGALGRNVNRGVANRIAGLRSSAYLAIPGPVVPGISEIPMARVDQVSSDVTKLLFHRARELVHDENWQTEGVNNSEESRWTRELNRAFLALSEPQTREIRMWRWRPAGGRQLLFVEAVWLDEDRKLPLFAVDAVVDDRGDPAVVSFSYRKAEWMRMSEFRGRDWRIRDEDGTFLNAWKAGAASYLLTYMGGYEGYSVELQRVDSAKGLVTILGFGR